MTPQKTALTIAMPALDEEGNIAAALEACLQALDEFHIQGEILVINDGSRDSTGAIVESRRARDSRIRMLVHERPRGIGASFWDGVDAARGDTIVMLPGDNQNDPREILQYLGLLVHVDIVIPYVYNNSVRTLFRNALSYAYRFIVNTTFLVNFNYTNGTNLYRTSVLRELNRRSEGFFFQTDILIRLVKSGYLFAQVPYRLGVRQGGVSRATSFPSLVQVVRGYFQLLKDFYWRGDLKSLAAFAPNSATQARRSPSAAPAAVPPSAP